MTDTNNDGEEELTQEELLRLARETKWCIAIPDATHLLDADEINSKMGGSSSDDVVILSSDDDDPMASSKKPNPSSKNLETLNSKKKKPARLDSDSEGFLSSGVESESESTPSSSSKSSSKVNKRKASRAVVEESSDDDFSPSNSKKQKNNSSKKSRSYSSSSDEVMPTSRRGRRLNAAAKPLISSSEDEKVVNKKKLAVEDSDEDSGGRRYPRRGVKAVIDSSESDDDDSVQEVGLDESDIDHNTDVSLDEDEDLEISANTTIRSRKLITADKLVKETREAQEAEAKRVERLKQRQKEFNGIEIDKDSTQTKLTSVVLDPDKETPVSVHPALVNVLLPHQAEGMKFMYDCAIESLDQLRDNNEGGGGILAHCMGLGKTLQVVAFVHTLLAHPVINKTIRKVLIVVPKNVIINWKNEFEKWLDTRSHRILCFDVDEIDSCTSNQDRLDSLKHWHRSNRCSVMIIGYDMFRILTERPEDHVQKKRPPKTRKPPKKLSSNQKRFKSMQDHFRRLLQDPGPDLVVCDEGHKLKNDESILSQTMMRIATRRRLCLTGTPLQNNLFEYHVMVSFVRPGLLGTKSEFANRFANPINNGRTKDASPMEVQFMRRRCHVLAERLKNVVHRRDISVLQTQIPNKSEYVLYVRLTESQNALYGGFLSTIKNFRDVAKRLLADYHQLSRIWTHPYQLYHHALEAERKRVLRGDDFINDDDEDSCSESSVDLTRPGACDSDDSDLVVRRSRRLNGDDVPERPDTPIEELTWWGQYGIVSKECKFDLEMSNKLSLLFAVIKQCEAVGDKVLVFSQSLESLRLIKDYLAYLDSTRKWWSDGHECLAAGKERWGWKEGDDFMVIDGSVATRFREAIQQKFNSPANLRARLLLISTRAGSLGTNMIAANRVVIFDACWNPSHDTQSLFRVYRIGQKKPVYIYRLIAEGTMEERIYKRQVTKESTSLRVIDEQQIQRHFTASDLQELYTLSSTPYDPTRETMLPPVDRLLAGVIRDNKQAVVEYIAHDTLFENVDEENLTEADRQAAWAEFEENRDQPKDAPRNPMVQNHVDLDDVEAYYRNLGAMANNPAFHEAFAMLTQRHWQNNQARQQTQQPAASQPAPNTQPLPNTQFRLLNVRPSEPQVVDLTDSPPAPAPAPRPTNSAMATAQIMEQRAFSSVPRPGAGATTVAGVNGPIRVVNPADVMNHGHPKPPMRTIRPQISRFSANNQNNPPTISNNSALTPKSQANLQNRASRRSNLPTDTLGSVMAKFDPGMHNGVFSDPMFEFAKRHSMTPNDAASFVYIKLVLQQLVDMVPEADRGDLDVEHEMIKLFDESGDATSPEKLRMAHKIFQTLLPGFERCFACTTRLSRLRVLSPWLFAAQ